MTTGSSFQNTELLLNNEMQSTSDICLSTNEVELPHNVEDSNKSYEPNAHDKNHIRRDLQAWSVISVKLKHGPSSTS